MAKEELLEFSGIVTECLPDARFIVTLDRGQTITGYPSGKMRKNHIRIVSGDCVKVEVTPYDLGKGRITFRHKDGGPRPGEQTGGS